MATIKSFTSLEQSRKLAEILPLESADMSWVSNGLGKPFARTIPIKGDPEELCGCWSLAALLEVLDDEITKDNEETLKLHIEKEGLQYYLYYENLDTGNMFELETEMYDDLVDCCVEMIDKLYKQNLK